MRPASYKSQVKIWQAEHRQRNYDRYLEILKKSACKDCGNSDFRVLDFDHLPGCVKRFNIARAVGASTRSWKAIEDEIAKCEVVCSNCHRIRTLERMGSRKIL